MQAKVKKEKDAYVIQLSGKVDFDSSEPFRKTVMNHIVGSNVVFNMSELDFVGSNGITPFVETIKNLCDSTEGSVRFCNLSSEFVRIFEANEIPFGVNFRDEFSAVNSLLSRVGNSLPDFQYGPGEVSGEPGAEPIKPETPSVHLESSVQSFPIRLLGFGPEESDS